MPHQLHVRKKSRKAGIGIWNDVVAEFNLKSAFWSTSKHSISTAFCLENS
jgi:hypothetical protein